MTAPAGGTLGSAVVRVVADVRRFARSVRAGITGAFGGRGPGSIYYGANYAGRQAGDAFATRFVQGMAGGLQAAGRAFAKVFNPNLLMAGTKALALVAAIKQLVLLGPAIAGVGQALAGIAALLPALAVTGVLVSKTLSTAFKGVGEAMSAAAEGDAAKLNEAIKDLSPSAQAFVKEVAKIAPEWEKVGKAVQESFFAPFRGAFSELANPTVLGALRKAMTGIADSLGRAAAGVAKTIGAAGRSGQLDRVFAPLAKAVDHIVKHAPAMTQVFINLAEAGAPVIERLARLLSGKIGGFLDRINAYIASGKLDELFENMAKGAGALFSVLGDLGSIIGSVLGGLNVEGESAVGMIGELINKLATFLKTAEGVEALSAIGKFISQLGGLLGELILPFLPVAAKLISILGEGLTLAFAHLRAPLVEVAEALGGLLMPVLEELAPVFKDLIHEIAGPLGQALSILAEHIVKMTPTAVEMVQIFGPLLSQVFKQFGDLLVELLPFLSEFAEILQENTWIFKTIAGTLGAAFAIISGGIYVLQVLVWLWGEFAKVMKDEIWPRMPELLSATGRVAIWVWEAIGDLVGAIAGLWDEVVSGGENAMAFIGAIPGKISALAGAFFQSAANLGGAIGRGFQNIGNFASEIGGKIYGTIRNGLNAIVGSINAGIARIDSVIPGALPRLSMFERGGIIDSPTLAVMGEGNKREVVLPLTDPARTAQLAQESGLMDILRGSGVFGALAPIINITAVLDGFGVIRVVDQRVETKMNEQGRELAFGTRGV
jgi:phage-related protein